MNRAASILAASVLLFAVAASLSGRVEAQAKAERGDSADATAPNLQDGKGSSPPRATQRRQAPVPDDDAQADNDAPSVPQGCPDQQRKLELII